MLAAIAQGISTGLNIYGSLESGQMQYDSLNNQAGMQRNNATLALQKGQFDALRQQMFARRKISDIAAGYSASGVSSNSGSVLAVLGDSAANAELDRLNILHGADIRSVSYKNQAAIDQFGAKSALTASYWNALGALTGGAARGFSYGTGGSTGESGYSTQGSEGDIPGSDGTSYTTTADGIDA